MALIIAWIGGAVTVLAGVLLAESLAKHREQKNRFDDAQMEMWALGGSIFDSHFEQNDHQRILFLTCLGRMLRESHDPLPNARPIATEIVAMIRRYSEVKQAWEQGDRTKDGRYVIGDTLSSLTTWHRPELEPPS